MVRTVRTFLWIALIYACLFGFMAAVNEFVRPTVKKHGYRYYGIPTIHPDASLQGRCTWKCHNRDFEHSWCRKNHLKMDRAYLAITDIPYYFIIKSLMRTGSYQAANILVLVGIFPTAILWLFVRSIEMQISIRKLDRKS